MAIVLGDNQYGKAETRVVRIYRDTERHEIRDLNVSTVRISVNGAGHPHAFVRSGQEIRCAAAVIDVERPVRAEWVVSGLRDLVVLKSTGSQFTGFLRDRYTTLAEASDRILATSLTARWRYIGTDVPWDEAFAQVRGVLLERFAVPHSKALPQTLCRSPAGPT